MWRKVCFKVRKIIFLRSQILFRSGKGHRADAGEELPTESDCEKRDGAALRCVLVKDQRGAEERLCSEEEHGGRDQKSGRPDEKLFQQRAGETGQPGATEQGCLELLGERCAMTLYINHYQKELNPTRLIAIDPRNGG